MGTWYMSLPLVLFAILFVCILGDNANTSRALSFPPSLLDSLRECFCKNITENLSGEDEKNATFIFYNISNSEGQIITRAAAIYEDECLAAQQYIDMRTKFLSRMSCEDPLTRLEFPPNNFSYFISSKEFCQNNNWESNAENGGGLNLRDLSGCRNLSFLSVTGEELSGKDFTNIVNLTNLKNLDLSNTSLTSIIPSDICKLEKLTSLDLSNNNLSGMIPSDIQKLVSLQSLNLSHNSLIGSIPDLTSMKSLIKLDLSSNNLSGNISVPLENKLKSILQVNLSNNPGLIICSENEELVKFIGLINNCISSGAEIPTSQNPSKDEKGNKQNVLLVVLLSLLFLVLLLFFLLFVVRKISNLSSSNVINKNGGEYSSVGPYSFQTPSMTWDVNIKFPTSVPVVIIDKPLLNLTFADVLSATNQFDQSTLLSEGRSGLVYCGELRGGFHVAIKVLVQGSFLTDRELASELERLGRIKHPNLVPLVGYCLAGSQRMVIFEYMENCNLHNLLHDFNSTETVSEAVVVEQEWNLSCINGENYEPYNGEINSWSFRHRLAVGIARGLAFLHHACSPQIVHGDVKASSIFLDSEFEPRFSDYGLAKITINPEDENTFQSPGYISPDTSSGSPPCFATAQSDVYGFGIVLFEIVTGKKPRDDEYPGDKDDNLVSWIRGLVIKGELFKAIDSSIRQTGPMRQMEEALKIGYLCTFETLSKRPTMQQVLGLLKDIEPGGFGK